MAEDLTCPPLGTGSIDMNALDAALKKKGCDPVKALADATTGGSPVLPDAAPAVEPAPEPAPEPFDPA